MPHLVQMHQKLEKDGLATITVSLDSPEETPDAHAKVLKVLQKQGVRISANVILDESSELWQNKLNIGGPPLIVIFDRDNKLIKTFDFVEDFDKDVGAYVEGVLKKK
ncbi:MAG: hypothetical protein AB7K24_34835 [Gemmataceae bacterium]